MINFIKEYLSWWLPAVFLVVFNAPGLFGDMLRVDPAYGWLTFQDNSQILKSFNQDIVQGSYPYWFFSNWVLENGYSLEWNPFIFGGQPLLAEGAYPLTGLVARVAHLFGPALGFSVYPFLIGLCVIVCSNLILSALNVPNWAKVVSVTLMCMSRFSLAMFQVVYSEVFIWFLFSILAILWIWKSDTPRTKYLWAVLGGLISGLMHYGSHVQFTLLSTLPFILIFILSCSILTKNSSLRWPSLSVLGFGGLFLLVNVLSGLSMWLPTLELSLESYRTITPKNSFFPNYINFMPLPFPKDEDIRIALHSWFNMQPITNHIYKMLPVQNIPAFGFYLDGAYFTLTAYVLCIIALLEKTTRKIVAPLAVTYVVIVVGYNIIASLAKISFVNSALQLVPLLDSVNLPIVVHRANILIWLGSGVGLVALVNLYKSERWNRIVKVWFLGICGWLALAFYSSWAMKYFLKQDYATHVLSKTDRFPENIAPLIGLRIEELLERWEPVPWQFTVCFILLVLEFIIAINFAKKEKFKYVLSGVLSASFALSGIVAYYDKLTWTPKDQLIPSVPAIDLIHQIDPASRVIALRGELDKKARRDNYLETIRNADDIHLGKAVQITRELPVAGGMSLLYRLQDVKGVSALNGRDIRIFIEAVTGHGSIEIPRMSSEFYKDLPIESHSYDALNVRWILSPDVLPVDHYELKLKGGLNLYENTNYWPRAWLAESYQVVKSRKEILQKLNSEKIGLDKVLLEVTPREDKEGLAQTGYGLTPEIPVKVRKETYNWVSRPNSVAKLFYNFVGTQDEVIGKQVSELGQGTIESLTSNDLNIKRYKVNMEEKGLLVLNEPYFPGWQVSVDGQSKNLYRTNFAFMSVQVPAGEHVIELRYESLTRKVSEVISISVAGVVLFLSLIWMFFPSISLRSLFLKSINYGKDNRHFE